MMADEIDIEEHKIMENPVIKNKFLNLSVIKNETCNYNDELEATPYLKQKLSLCPDLKQISLINNCTEKCEEATNIPNSIAKVTTSDNNHLQSNKIILGSKPNKVSVDQNLFDKWVPYQANIVLQDIQSYLSKSRRYCETCCILFPEPRDFETHVLKFHSQNDISGTLNTNMDKTSEENRCNICSKAYATKHVLIRHMKSKHIEHSKIAENDISDSLNTTMDKTNKENRCHICSNTYATKYVLKQHMKSKHKEHSEITGNDVTDTLNATMDKKSEEHRCHICSNTYVTKHVLTKHMEDKHNKHSANNMDTPKYIEKGTAIDINKKTNTTDLSNTCFHCKKSFHTQKTLIDHLYDVLQTKKKSTEIVPVLKSVLFKCNKCDINFVSSQIAASHTDHMEMLINWKCSICSRIFKKEDELNHERQHSVSNHFVMYNLGEVDVNKILFRCSKCATHFTEKAFLFHFRDCGLKKSKSAHCKICDILLDDDIVASHNFDHIQTGRNVNRFTVIETEVISDNPVKDKSKEKQLKNNVSDLLKSFSEVKIVLKRLENDELLYNSYMKRNKEQNADSNSFQSATSNGVDKKHCKAVKNKLAGKWAQRRLVSKSMPKDRNISKTDRRKFEIDSNIRKRKIMTKKDFSYPLRKMPNLAYSYCDYCKCFLTKFKNLTHMQSRCTRLKNRVCKHCGLKFTMTSLTTHNKLHEKNKNLKLTNFKFYNLYNGLPMSPPIPEYPKCVACGVHFLSISARVNHACSEEAYLTCLICEMKLSEAAFKLHMMFHHYTREVNQITSSKYLQSDINFDYNDSNTCNIEKPTANSLNIQQHTRYTKEVNQTTVSNYIQSDINLDYNDSNACNIEKPTANNLNIQQHTRYTKEMNQTTSSKYIQSDINLDYNDSNTWNIEKPTANNLNIQNLGLCKSDDSLQKSCSDLGEIIYTCKNCRVTVDTYDKVIEHCQGHCNVESKGTETMLCNICKLDIDKESYEEHHNTHEQGRKFNVLKFDSYYFPEENYLWVNHIFKCIPNDKVMEILSKSIYRYEGRIKMDIIQQGAPNLTVYKCDRCDCFIEPHSLFKHADNSCFKLRKHPCSFCGLPFNSSASRADHEQIHKNPGATIKSYRIVLFNREQDRELNKSFCFRKRYVLYQCRNCNGVIDKLESDVHECDISNLKKCPNCALLIYNKDYEAHTTAHREFDSFNYKNMKVVLLGNVNRAVQKGWRSNFQGNVHDYRMYRCNKCQLCIKNEKFIPKHSCYYGRPQSKCPKCCLYFSVSRLKTHMRYHDRDPDYVRSNMTMISFDPSNWDQNENTTIRTGSGDCELTDSNSDSDSDYVMNEEEQSQNNHEQSAREKKEVVEEIAKIYKCACGLHFLNEDSILRHFGVCRSNIRTSKQECSKCNLLFTSNVLFTHMLAHHSNKNRRYKYEIIDRYDVPKVS